MDENRNTPTRNTVLVIDDQPRNLQLAAYVLNPFYELILVNSGDKGIRMATEKCPDLILLDIMMPEMSGYEVCARLKENPDTKNIPVIFVTAKTEEEDIIQAYEVGGVDYVLKPFRAKELLVRVQTHLAIREAQQKTEQLNAHLRELNQNKDRLFSVISHDLRGNAGRIDSLVHLILLEMKENSAAAMEMLPMLKESSRKNKELLEDLLLWARSQFDKIEYRPASLAVEEVVNRAEEQVKIQAEGKQISFVRELSHDLKIFADLNMIITVLRNLYSNAIKFSQAKSTIKTKAYGQAGKVLIEVTDSGMGIQKEHLDKLFNQSKSRTTTGTAGEKGSGFGLELCYDFVKKNGGEITVQSEWEKGSTFTIILPEVKNN